MCLPCIWIMLFRFLVNCVIQAHWYIYLSDIPMGMKIPMLSWDALKYYLLIIKLKFIKVHNNNWLMKKHDTPRWKGARTDGIQCPDMPTHIMYPLFRNEHLKYPKFLIGSTKRLWLRYWHTIEILAEIVIILCSESSAYAVLLLYLVNSNSYYVSWLPTRTMVPMVALSHSTYQFRIRTMIPMWDLVAVVVSFIPIVRNANRDPDGLHRETWNCFPAPPLLLEAGLAASLLCFADLTTQLEV